MATQTDVPSDLPDDDKAYAFQCLDAQLNSTILYALLHGGQQHLLSWNVGVDQCQEYIPAFLLLRCGIYVGQEHFHYNIQSDVNGTVINKCWPIRRAMVIVIILLHALITINFSATWSYIHSAFIQNGQNFWTVYLKLNSADQAVTWEMGITASIGTILTDLYMVYSTSLRGLLAFAQHHLYYRFGIAGWFGDDVGLLFCFHCFL